MKMSKFKFRQEEKIINHMFIADVELIEGPAPGFYEFSDRIICNDSVFEVPIEIIKLGESGKEYRLFINVVNLAESKKNELFNEIKSAVMSFSFKECTSFEYVPSCKKMIFILNDEGLRESLPIINLYALNNKEISIYVFSDKKESEILGEENGLFENRITFLSTAESRTIRSILSGQVIGTNLFIAESWSMINLVKNIALAAGYSDEEIQYRAYGEKKENVYCAKCYSYNRRTNSSVITCEHCNTKLDVSNHFSKRLDAYLGYIHLA